MIQHAAVGTTTSSTVNTFASCCQKAHWMIGPHSSAGAVVTQKSFEPQLARHLTLYPFLLLAGVSVGHGTRCEATKASDAEPCEDGCSVAQTTVYVRSSPPSLFRPHEYFRKGLVRGKGRARIVSAGASSAWLCSGGSCTSAFQRCCEVPGCLRLWPGFEQGASRDLAAVAVGARSRFRVRPATSVGLVLARDVGARRNANLGSTSSRRRRHRGGALSSMALGWLLRPAARVDRDVHHQTCVAADRDHVVGRGPLYRSSNNVPAPRGDGILARHLIKASERASVSSSLAPSPCE